MDNLKIIEEIVGGHSGAKMYKARKDDNIYCLKIRNGLADDKYFNKIKEISQIYKEIQVNSLEVYDCGNLDKDAKHYILYNYIDGVDFKVYSDENLNDEELYNSGRNLGKKFKVLKEYKLPKDTFIDDLDIDEETNLVNYKYAEIIKDKQKAEMLKKYFGFDKIEQKHEKFNKYKEIFKTIDRGLIHGDIKRTNFMTGKDGKHYVIDFGGMKNSYDIFSFRYQITWLLFRHRVRERIFVKGYFDELYNNQRPQDFDKQIEFAVFMNFIGHIYKHSELDNLKDYFENMKIVFDDLENKTNII